MLQTFPTVSGSSLLAGLHSEGQHSPERLHDSLPIPNSLGHPVPWQKGFPWICIANWKHAVNSNKSKRCLPLIFPRQALWMFLFRSSHLDALLFSGVGGGVTKGLSQSPDREKNEAAAHRDSYPYCAPDFSVEPATNSAWVPRWQMSRLRKSLSTFLRL